MNITEKFAELAMDEHENYSDELNQYIRSHNKSISEFAQSITIGSIVSLLIKKGILTDDEITNELTAIINENQANIKQIEDNKVMLCQLIEYESEYIQNLKDMHDDLINREGTEVTLSADLGISVMENENATDTSFEVTDSIIK